MQMTAGQICFLQEYCTNCPIRKECTIRPKFYSDEEYGYWKKITLESTALVAKKLYPNSPLSVLNLSLDAGIKMMDKRRAKELELHKTYSPT